MDNDDIIDTLNKLIETSKDGEYGFNSCAEHVKSPQLRSVFIQRARNCREGAMELQTLVVGLGGKAEDDGTAGGAMHRGWVAVKGTLTGYDDQAMLNECERGEDVALARYRKALEQPLPVQIRGVLQRQFEGVQANHDQIRDLRDRMGQLP